MSRQQILGVLLWVIAVGGAHAETGQFSVSSVTGYLKFDDDMGLKNTAVIGLGGEYALSDNYGMAISWARGDADIRGGQGDVKIELYGIEGIYYLPPDQKWQPFLTFGGGHRQINGNSEGTEDTQVHVGGGVNYGVWSKYALNAELKVIHNLHNEGVDALLLFGITRVFGEK